MQLKKQTNENQNNNHNKAIKKKKLKGIVVAHAGFPALRRKERQEDCESGAGLGYTVRPGLKKPNKSNNGSSESYLTAIFDYG